MRNKKGHASEKEGLARSIKVTRKCEGQSWNHMAALKTLCGRLCLRGAGGRCGGGEALVSVLRSDGEEAPGGNTHMSHINENTHTQEVKDMMLLRKWRTALV